MLYFDSSSGPRIEAEGRKMRKLPNPVFMLPVDDFAEVETNEGVVHANPGDFVAHDPISGHVWPVAGSYVAQHYVPWPQGEQE